MACRLRRLCRADVERDQEIIWRDSGSVDYAIVQGLQQCQALLSRTARDEGDFKYDQVIRVAECPRNEGV